MSIGYKLLGFLTNLFGLAYVNQLHHTFCVRKGQVASWPLMALFLHPKVNPFCYVFILLLPYVIAVCVRDARLLVEHLISPPVTHLLRPPSQYLIDSHV